MSSAKYTQSIIRNLQRGITPQQEIEALRKINPQLAAIAEQQNEQARSAIAKATGAS